MPDSDTIRTAALVLVLVALIGAMAVSYIVKKAVVRLVLILVLFVMGASMWLLREQLNDCARTCNCRLLAQDIEVPKCVSPPIALDDGRTISLDAASLDAALQGALEPS